MCASMRSRGTAVSSALLFAAALFVAQLWCLSFIPVVDAYHGFALATTSVGDLKSTTEWQLACAKTDLITSDFYATPSMAVTVAFWMRADAANDLTSWWGVSSKQNPNLFRIFQYPEKAEGGGNTLEMVQMDSGYFKVSDADGDFNFSEWNHFAYVREAGASGSGRWYVNGVEKANQTNTAMSEIEMADDNTDEFTNMCFGGYSQLYDAMTRERSSFSAMDDFYFITRALSPTEVTAMYQDSRYVEAVPPDPDVKLYYSFDDVRPYTPPASPCGGGGGGSVTGVLEIQNHGVIGSKYNLLTGMLNGKTEINDTVARKAVSLVNPKFTPSGAGISPVFDMGVGDEEYGLVIPIGGADALHPLPGLWPGIYRFSTLPQQGVLKVQAVSSGTYVDVVLGQDYVLDPGTQALYWQIDDWSAIPDFAANARCTDSTDCPRLGVRHVTFVLEQLTNDVAMTMNGSVGNTTVVLMDATSAPVASWSEFEVVEDGTASFLALFSEDAALAYEVTVESIAGGATLTLTNGTAVRAGDTIDSGYKTLAATPPPDFQGTLSDAFCLSATNAIGVQSNVTCMSLTSIAYNDIPVIASSGAIAMNNTANYTIDIGALVSDADADVTSITIEQMPRKGRLFLENGVEILQEFRLNELETEYYQPVADVLNISSFYSWGSDRWHATAIIGPRQVFTYGDSDLAWCPQTKTGTGVSVDRSLINTFSVAQNKSYPYGPFDHDAAYDSHGFTEYLELRFENPVYPTSVEIGMPRGMGSVKSVWSESPNGQTRPTGAASGSGLESDRKWIQLFTTRPDESIQEEAAKFNQYYIYNEDVCKIAEKVDTLRIELDTRIVEDWNEIDYVYLYGTDALPMGVIPFGAQTITYVPHENAWGSDEIKFNAYDCAYRKYSKATLDATISIDVSPTPSFTGTVVERKLVPQVRSTESGTAISLLPERVDASAHLASRALTITSLPPLADVMVDGSTSIGTGQLPFAMPSPNSTLTLKPYNCNVNVAGNVGHQVAYEYADSVSSERLLGRIELEIPCLSDLAEPCSSAHWSFSVGSCTKENTRQGSYLFSTGTAFAPSTLCCNSLNDDERVCPTGALLPAPFSVECDYIVTESNLSIVFITLSIFFVLVLLAFCGFVMINQKRIMRGNTMFLIGCNLGGILGILTIVIYPGAWTTDKCRLMVALPSLAFTTIFTSMVLKAWRIDAIFNNKTLLAARIGLPQILSRFLSILCLDLVLIFGFVFANNVHQTSHYKSVDGRQVQYSECTTDGVYMGYILLLYKFLLLVYGVILAVRVRKVSQELSETKYIVYSIYSVAIVGIMGIYLYLFSDMETEAAFTAFGICVLLIFSMPSFFILTPRLIEILFPDMTSDQFRIQLRTSGMTVTSANDKFATGKDFNLTTAADLWIDQVKEGADNEQLLNMLAEQQEEIRMLKVILEQQGQYRSSAVHPASIKSMFAAQMKRDRERVTLSSSANDMSRTGPDGRTMSRGSLHFEGSQLMGDN